MAGLRHSDWYLIAEQRFRQRAVVDLVAQSFRGEPFIVLCDRLSGQYLRLSARVKMLWDRLDGTRTMQDLWYDMSRLPGSYAPTQAELMDWTMQLAASGLILSDHDIDPKHLAYRLGQRRDRMLEGKAASPLSLKIPLFDPSKTIRAVYPFVRPLLTRGGMWGLIALYLTALVLAVMNAGALAGGIDSALLSQSGLLTMVLTYPVMKAIHETGHGVVLHHFGGDTRECGVMLLLFFPVPYVDASATNAVPAPAARMLVGAAGILAELACASVALLLWLMIEPGPEQAILYSFMVMGAISTLAFNGNPLLKFDAYYVLADALQIPNLASRGGAWLQDRFLAAVLGLRPREVCRPGEAPWLTGYAVLALGYRMLLMLTIVLVVSQILFVLGVALAIWAVVTGVVWPLVKLVRKGRDMARAENARRRVGLRVLGVVAAIVGFSLLVPLPFAASGSGRIVAIPEAELRLGASGFLTPEAAAAARPEASAVTAGEALLQLTNLQQDMQLRALRQENAGIGTSLSAAGLPPAQREVALARMQANDVELAELDRLQRNLTLAAPLAGRLAWVGGQPPVAGSYVSRGDLVGRITGPGLVEAVLALPPFYAGVMPPDGSAVTLRLPDGTEVAARIARRRVLDSGDPVPEALLVRNGGSIAESTSKQGTALEPALVIWAAFDDDLSGALGQRADMHVALMPKPLAGQILFQIDRLFLRVTRF